MNTTVKTNFVTCIAILSLACAALPASARHGHGGCGGWDNHRGWTALGVGAAVGLLSGIAIARTPVYAAPAPVVYAPAPAVVYAPAPTVVVTQPGRWVDQEERVWIEGCWLQSVDVYGRMIRTWQPGHWEIRRTRVWIQ